MMQRMNVISYDLPIEDEPVGSSKGWEYWVDEEVGDDLEANATELVVFGNLSL